MFSNAMNNSKQNAEWLNQGIIYLTPKTDESAKPENYQSIIFIHNILTLILSEIMCQFLETNYIISENHKRCKIGFYDCKN